MMRKAHKNNVIRKKSSIFAQQKQERMKQTKIVASISDLRCSQSFIRDLFNAGVNVVRINTAHASAECIREIIKNTRAVSRKHSINYR